MDQAIDGLTWQTNLIHSSLLLSAPVSGDVGVAGYILGGGISFFSGQYGWACDNVLRYDVVLSSGATVYATPTENTDLYYALKGGGGSDYGIVVNFELEAFEQREIWKRSLVFPGSQNQTLISKYTQNVLKEITADDKAHSYFVMSYQSSLGGYVVLPTFYYATPPPKGTPPPFKGWDNVHGAISDKVTVDDVSTTIKALNEPYGHRQNWMDATVALSSEHFLQSLVPVWQAAVDKFNHATAGKKSKITSYFTFQPITTNVMQHMQKNGGNPLPLKPNKDNSNPKMIISLANTWDDASLDDLVQSESQKFVDTVEKMASAAKVHEDYIYMNYAGAKQPVLESYGSATHAKLAKISTKYDPYNTSKHWPGYFKL